MHIINFLLVLLSLVSTLSIAATQKVLSGTVTNLKYSASQLSFDCHLDVDGNQHAHHVDLNTDNRELSILLNDGVQVLGQAALTRVPDSEYAHYFLTNGSIPFRYSFTVSVNQDFSAAKLQLVQNAILIDCQ